jgi:hypothetical protein
MITEMTIMHPGAEPEVRQEDWPEAPGYRFLAEKIGPVVRGDVERVNVFWDGAYTDMFVNETGALMSLPRNEAATVIYRNNWLTHQDPAADPESLPAIYGPAVLMSRKVWF